jgi:hypothetical protein
MPVVDVATFAELIAALATAAPGTVIRLAPGIYVVDQPLVVPDGVTLRPKSGVSMTYDVHGCPDALAGAGLATLKADPALKGDLVTLHDGAVLRLLKIEDVAGRSSGVGKWGNPVAVFTRKPQDMITATIDRCEIINALTTGVEPFIGPEGRGVCIVSRTTGMAGATAPHADSTLKVRLRRTRIRAPNNGLGIFAINFAARSRIMLRIDQCRIGGGLDAIGGTSRPHVVTGAQVFIHSSRTCYVNDGSVAKSFGMMLNGGTLPPAPAFAPLHTSNNLLMLESRNDRIEGFESGIIARGGARFNATPAHGPVNGNRAILRLIETTFLGIAKSDLALAGASSNGDYPPGDENVLTATILRVTGLGTTAEEYLHARGAIPAELPPHLSGGGNRLEVIGDPDSFAASNPGIAVPDAKFFL